MIVTRYTPYNRYRVCNKSSAPLLPWRFSFRDWSLITGREGGATKWEGGRHVKFYPYEKGGGAKSFSHAEGGGTTSFGVVFTW